MTRNADGDSNVEKNAERESRRPYRRPQLRRLGSVRELTLGSSKGKDEGGGTKKNTM